MQSTKQNKLIGDWIQSDEELRIATIHGEKKIGQFNREDMGNIVDCLAQWRLMLGVTTDTTQEELIFITQFIYDNYKHLALNDIVMARNWAIIGRIDVGFVSQKIFSTYYISRCIGAYEEEKRKILNELDYKRERYLSRQAIENPSPVTPEQKANTFKDYILSMYQAHKQGKEIMDLGDMCYNWAKNVGLIKPDQKEIDEALRYAQERLLQAKQEKFLMDSLVNYQGLDDETRKKKFARIFVIMNMFAKYSPSELISYIKIDDFKK